MVSFDTNISVSANLSAPLAKTHRARDLLLRGMRTGSSILLLQTLTEFSTVAIRKAGIEVDAVRLSRAPKTRGKYAPAQQRRTSPNPPRVKTPTGHQGAQAIPNAEIYLSNASAVPNGKSYLSNVSNAESYLPTPLSTRDVKKQDKQPVASHTGIWGAAQKR